MSDEVCVSPKEVLASTGKARADRDAEHLRVESAQRARIARLEQKLIEVGIDPNDL